VLAQDRHEALYCPGGCGRRSCEDPKKPQRRGEQLKTFLSHNKEETIAFGELIGKAAPGGSVIAFRGDLGAGKTTLSKGIAQGLGIDEEVTSPTYTIVSEYRGRLALYHIDAYRLAGESDFAEIGGYDMLESAGSLCLIEWSERLPGIVNDSTAIIDIRVEHGDERRLSLSGAWLEALLP
jgi:tRNA threonylcarbamoyladenosine biosynthesis protein TsaE